MFTTFPIIILSLIRLVCRGIIQPPKIISTQKGTGREVTFGEHGDQLTKTNSTHTCSLVVEPENK